MNPIQKYFESYQDVLLNSFNRIRSTHSDSSVKGGRNEQIICEFLEEHVENKFVARNVQIIDSLGNASDEIDVCVCNEYQPFNTSNSEILIGEGVDFTVQVKAILSNEELDRIIKNCASIKKIQRLFDKGDEFQGEIGDLNYFINRIPYVVFAFDSKTSIETMYKNLTIKLKDIPLELQPDAIFVLGKGCIINFREGNGSTYTVNEKKLSGLSGFLLEEKTLLEFIRYITYIVPRIKRHSKTINIYLRNMTFDKPLITNQKL